MIRLIQGDITRLRVDAVVNAANSSLLGGGGVDGAIHRAGGHKILEACIEIRRKQGGCQTGNAVITVAGKLPAQYVIHAVGPVWNGGSSNEDELLTSAYRSCLRLATEYELNSIAFPNISTGIFGFPKQRAASIAIQEVSQYLANAITHPNETIFCCFDEENYRIYDQLLN